MQQRFGITDQKVNVAFKSRILNKITHFEQARANSKKTQHDNNNNNNNNNFI